MLYVKQVAGSVKGPLNVTLGPKTLIVGRNGAGKSRVGNAVELALSGCARDIGGKAEVREAAVLISLAPDGEPLHAVAKLSDDRSAAYRLERRPKGKLAKAEHAPIEGLSVTFPAQAAMDALRGSTARGRSFVLQYGTQPAAVTDAALTERIKAPLRGLFSQVFGAIPAGDPVGRLLAAQDQIAARTRAVRGEIKGAQGVLDNLRASGGFGLTPPDSADAERRRQYAQQQLDLVRGQIEALGPAPVAPTVARVTEADVLDMHGRLTRAVQHYHEAHAAYSAHEQAGAPAAVEAPADPPALPLLGAIVTMLGASAPYAGHTLACPVCQQAWAVPDVAPRLAQTRQAAADAEGAVTAGRAASAEADRQIRAWGAERDRLGAELQRAHAEAARLSAEYPALCERFRATGSPSLQAQADHDQATHEWQTRGNALGREAAIAHNDVQIATAEIRAAHQQEGAREQTARAQDTVAGLEAEERDLVALGGSVAEVVGMLTDEARQAFAARVQAYLPKTDTFDVELHRGDSEVCLFGFRRGAELHTALSGAEQARLAMALGSVLAEQAGADLSVILPEERSYDPETLAATMRALTGSKAQIIITSPIKPRGKLPAGWTLIEVDADPGAAEIASE